MKKRVYIIYTGGTLGMQKTERGFRPVPNWFEQQLRELDVLNAPDMPEFTFNEYTPLLDSSDIRPEHWLTMAQDIAANYQQYDGFVILHGTDTMAYTAAALHILLENLAKPVIITGAQIPLSEEHSDTVTNVRNALYAAAHSSIKQVGLLFHRRVFLGEYATKYSTASLDGFASPNTKPLLEWPGEYLQLEPASNTESASLPDLVVKNFTPKQVTVLTFHPGMNFELIANSLNQPWDAVILHSFGSGNIPQNPLLLNTLAKLSQKGVTLYNCSQCLHGEVATKYASGYLMADMGVIAVGDRTLEATLALAHIG